MNVTVIGAGSSGIAVLRKLRGHDLFLTESKPALDRRTLSILRRLKVRYELGGNTSRSIKNADLVVVSPGVPMDIPIIRSARKRNIPVISEVEIAYFMLRRPIIAVTGTNGKTTTTTLIAQMLKDAGIRSIAAGNIGYPLVSVNDGRLDMVVAEISSYQLEGTVSFKPWISEILNITEDHLTRHGTMSEYARQKAAIFRNQDKGDWLIYNHDDPLVRRIIKPAKCRKIPFSRRNIVRTGAYVRDGAMFFGKKMICRVDDIRIKGDHNIENALAASAAALLAGARASSVASTLKRFKGVEHRIEYVKTLKGVSYFNDSKGTNPDSTVVAIRALKKDHGIVLILGGRDKMTDLGEMCREVKKNVKDVVLIGEARERFKKNLRKCGYSKLHEAGSLKQAVAISRSLAERGDAVLLSPACASFDMFSNYEERGRVFKKIVANLQDQG